MTAAYVLQGYRQQQPWILVVAVHCIMQRRDNCCCVVRSLTVAMAVTCCWLRRTAAHAARQADCQSVTEWWVAHVRGVHTLQSQAVVNTGFSVVDAANQGIAAHTGLGV